MRATRYLLLPLVTAARFALAQGSQPDLVPRRLIEEIAGGDTLRVGSLPPSLKDKLYLPSTSRIVGSLGNAAVVASSLSAAETLKDLEREMPKLGWKLVIHSRPDWGFVFSREDMNDYGLVFCGNDTWLTIHTLPSSGAGSRFRTSAARSPGTCDGISIVAGGPWRPPATYQGTTARLLNPPSARAAAYDVCTPGTMAWENGSVALLETSLDVDSLMSWYGKQLDDAGWRPTKPNGVTRSWTRVDSGGKLAQLDLHIDWKPDFPRCKEASYKIRLVKPPG